MRKQSQNTKRKSITETRNLTTIGDQHPQYLLNLDYNGDGKRDLPIAESATSQWNIVSFEDYTVQEQICEPDPGNGNLPFNTNSTNNASTNRFGGGGNLCFWVTTQKDLMLT